MVHSLSACWRKVLAGLAKIVSVFFADEQELNQLGSQAQGRCG